MKGVEYDLGAGPRRYAGEFGGNASVTQGPCGPGRVPWSSLCGAGGECWGKSGRGGAWTAKAGHDYHSIAVAGS